MSKNRHIILIKFRFNEKDIVVDLLQEDEDDLINKLVEALYLSEFEQEYLSISTGVTTIPSNILRIYPNTKGFTDQYLLQLLELRELLLDRWTLKDILKIGRANQLTYNIIDCIRSIRQALGKNLRVYKPYSQQTAAERAELAADLKHFIITRMSQGAIKETIQQLENEGLAQPGTARRVRNYYKEYYATGTEPALKLDKILDEGLNTDRMFMSHQPIYMDFMGYEMINIDDYLYEPFIGAYYVKEI
jgi:hypothetical protein